MSQKHVWVTGRQIPSTTSPEDIFEEQPVANASGLNICSGTCEAFVAGAAVRCGSVGVGVLLAEVGGEIHEEAALLPLRGGLGVVLVEVLTRVRLAEKKNTCPLTTVSSPYMCEAFVAGFF